MKKCQPFSHICFDPFEVCLSTGVWILRVGVPVHSSGFFALFRGDFNG
ncbi:MAG: hypothetical protein ACFFC7_12910 [Candidatus Hermodarchaeota archaeon]